MGFLTVFTVSNIGWWFGKKAEFYIDQIQPISYLNLNKGDQRVVENSTKDNQKNFLGFCVSIVSQVAVSLLSVLVGMGVGLN